MSDRPNLKKLTDEINKSQRPRTLALALVLLLTAEPCLKRGDGSLQEPEIRIG